MKLLTSLTFIAIALCGLGGVNVVAVTSATVLMGALFILSLLRTRRYASALLTMFLLYSVIPLWPMQVVASFPLSNWRGQIFPPHAIYDAIGFYCGSFALYAAAIATISMLLPMPRQTQEVVPVSAQRASIGGTRFLRYASILVGCLTVIGVAGQTRDAWISDADLTDRFIMQATTIASIAAYAANLEVRRESRVPIQMIDHFVLFAAIVVALQGFRFMLVAAAITYVFSLRHELTLRLPTLLKITACAGVLYLVLMVGMAIRAIAGEQAISMAEAFSQLDMDYIGLFFGAPEQTTMLALKYFLETPVQTLHGQTYLDAFLRVAPNVVHSAFFVTVRPQDYIIQEFRWASTWFTSAGLNIGSHMLIEGIINFGVIGGIAVMAIFGSIVAWLDYMVVSRRRLIGLGYAVCAFSYAAAWYGSSVFVKYSLFFLFAYSLVRFLSRLRFEKGLIERDR